MHLRDIARRTGIPLGTVHYHLQRLEARGLVVVHRDGHYKRYFTGHLLGPAQKQLLSSLRHDVQRRIAIAVLELRSATQRELSVRIGVSRSMLSSSVNELMARGILHRGDERPERGYSLHDAGMTSSILDRYAASLAGPAVAAATA